MPLALGYFSQIFSVIMTQTLLMLQQGLPSSVEMMVRNLHLHYQMWKTPKIFLHILSFTYSYPFFNIRVIIPQTWNNLIHQETGFSQMGVFKFTSYSLLESFVKYPF